MTNLDENFDVMLTAGEPPPSRLVARRLAKGRPAIYASADYLRLPDVRAPASPSANGPIVEILSVRRSPR